MKKVCIICASAGKNKELAEEVAQVLKSKNAEVKTLNIVDMNLPLYTSVSDAAHSAQALIQPFNETLNADAFIFLAPEYNGSTPPAFNNFLAWTSRSTKNWRDAFNGKTAGIGTFSGGGGSHVLVTMRLQLGFLGMNVLGRQLLASPYKAANPESIAAFCDELLKH